MKTRRSIERVRHQTTPHQMRPPRSYLNNSGCRELMELITRTVHPEDWAVRGGVIGDAEIGGGRLWVLQTREGHAAVRRLLAMLRSSDPPATKPASQPAVNPHADLQQRIPELNLESTTLEQSIDIVRRLTHANIFVYWMDLETQGVSRTAPIKLHLWDVTLDQALGAIFAVAGAELPRAVKDGVIVIGSPQRLNGGLAEVRIYDVRDFIRSYCAAHPSVPIVVHVQTGMPADTSMSIPADDASLDLSSIIKKTVDPDSWDDNGGTTGSISGYNGCLIITQTPSAHRRIAQLLQKLREGGTKNGRPVWPP